MVEQEGIKRIRIEIEKADRALLLVDDKTGLTEGVFLARRRHLDALIRAKELVENGLVQLQPSKAGELLAEDLRQAQNALGEITGHVSSDALLGKIFSSFCIGK